MNNFEQIAIIDLPARPRKTSHKPEAVRLRNRLAENGGDMTGFTDSEILTHQIGLIRGTDEAATIAYGTDVPAAEVPYIGLLEERVSG